MTLDAALELSLEQLISILDQKLFGECTRIRSTTLPASRVLVAAFTSKVRLCESKGNPQTSTRYFADRCSRETSQRGSTTSPFSEEFDSTGEPSSSRGPCVLCHFHLRFRPTTNHPLDPRLSTLAQVHRFQPRKLEVDRDEMEKACPPVPRTCRVSPSGCGRRSTRRQGERSFP